MIFEQEIKLIVTDPRQLELATLDWLKPYYDGLPLINQLESTYFDTPELYLINNGLGLRLRHDDGSWLQTVKSKGQVKDGLHQREEWEHRLTSAAFDLDKLKQTPLASMIDDSEIWPQLIAVFTTVFVRETLQLTLPEGSKIELAYDRGQVRAGQLVEPIHEIELELKAGTVEQLKSFASELCQHFPLQSGNESKAYRGYALVARQQD